MGNINNTYDNKELHSEKVRKFIEEIPPSLVCWSIIIIAVVVISLLSAICLLPYPYSNGETIIEHLIKGGVLH